MSRARLELNCQTEDHGLLMKEIHQSNLLSQKRLPHQSSPLGTLSETKSREADLPRTICPMSAADSTLLVLLAGSTCLGIIALVWGKLSSKLRVRGVSGLTSRLVPPVPCKNCRFFAQNKYLHCAVHPATVLTPQAANCSDYYGPEESDWQSSAQCSGHKNQLSCN